MSAARSFRAAPTTSRLVVSLLLGLVLSLVLTGAGILMPAVSG